MTHERWLEVKQKIEESFTVIDRYEEELDPGIADVLEFEGPGGRMKASFCRQPKVVDKKTLYSHRAGGEVKVDYRYSDTESVSYLSLFKWNKDRGDWDKMSGEDIF